MAGWEERFGDYVGRLGDVLGHADRRAPLRAYTTGLLLPGERKSVEPMAARVDPSRVGAAHQSLHHFVAKAAWDDATLLKAVRAYVLPAMLERGPVRAWIVDDNYFTTNVVNGPLTALADGVDGGDGVYAYGSGGVFPTSTYLKANYWVDVVFQ